MSFVDDSKLDFSNNELTSGDKVLMVSSPNKFFKKNFSRFRNNNSKWNKNGGSENKQGSPYSDKPKEELFKTYQKEE